MEPENNEEMVWELGIQPLDRLMEDYDLKNTDLVKYSEDQLSHKVVAKARRGRRLTKKSRLKVLRALNKALVEKEISERKVTLAELFNY